MSEQAWYRRTTWTDDDRNEFNARLRRSRGAGNKAQCLRIQALCLAEAGLHVGAMELLDRMFAEFPDELQLGQAHLQKAESLLQLGNPEGAIDEFRAALQSERDIPNVRTQAWLDFAWFIVENQLTHMYDEATRVLEEFRDESGLTFPVIEYRYCVVRALIAESRGDATAARQFARRAVEEAAKEHSGLRYHANVGLVGSQSEHLEKKLRTLASQH